MCDRCVIIGDEFQEEEIECDCLCEEHANEDSLKCPVCGHYFASVE